MDACLTSFGGIFDNQCYVFSHTKKFNKYSIVHLEMHNIEVALTIWTSQWSSKNLCIKYHNMAVVEVCRAKDAILALCARNIWLIYNISIHIDNILGENNMVADHLCRFKFDVASWQLLNHYICTSFYLGFYTH